MHLTRYEAIAYESRLLSILIYLYTRFKRSTALQQDKSSSQSNDLPLKRDIQSRKSILLYAVNLSNGPSNHPLAGISLLNTYETSRHQNSVYKTVEDRLYRQLLSLSGIVDGLQRGRDSQTIQRLCKNVSTLQRKALLGHLNDSFTRSFLMRFGQ